MIDPRTKFSYIKSLADTAGEYVVFRWIYEFIPFIPVLLLMAYGIAEESLEWILISMGFLSILLQIIRLKYKIENFNQTNND